MARATIKDVAKLAGYSITTVSLVLNHREVSIPKETRARIWDAVKQLDYRPNQLAVGMITKRSRILGLLIPDNSNVFFGDMSRYIERAARHNGYNLIYGNTDNNPNRNLEYMRMFIDRQVDGIIFSKSTAPGDNSDEELNAYISKSSVPFVSIDRRLNNGSVKSVILNNRRGGYLATNHLLQMGHKRIGAYTGLMNLAASEERLEGYRAALEEAGIAYDPAFVYQGDYQLGREREALAHFLDRRVTAIFCFNDLMAVGIYKAMRERGLMIPEDLSIVGFDNTPFGSLIIPELTTVAQPIKDMSECAVGLLLSAIEGKEMKDSRNTYIFEPQLVVRDSTQRISV